MKIKYVLQTFVMFFLCVCMFVNNFSLLHIFDFESYSSGYYVQFRD